jgi:2-dehydropantoate 2-reductase
MRIAIVGVGGVGGYFGAKLAHHYASHRDTQVIFIARGEHLERIEEDGLEVGTVEGDYRVKPDGATDNPKDLGVLDLILLAVKGYDLESGARLIIQNLGDQSVVIPLLNGVDNAERLRSLLPGGRILNGCVYVSAHLLKPGVVQQVGGPCRLLFGPEDGETEAFRDIEKILQDAGIKAELQSDIRAAVWEKYMFISPFACVSSLYNRPLGGILEFGETRDLLRGLMRELESVCDGQGVQVPENIVEISMEKASQFPYETKSSMQLDCEKGKNTELDLFAGYVVNSGAALGIDVPLYRMAYEKLKK